MENSWRDFEKFTEISQAIPTFISRCYYRIN